MARQEHVHIIAAGENIQTAYAKAIRDLRDITHTFIFADTELYTNTGRDDEETKAYKAAARDAVTKVKEIAASLTIPTFLFYVNPPASESVVKLLLKIKNDHRDAKYSFDLTAGSKDLSIALLALSLWLESDAYYAFRSQKGEKKTEKIPVPKIAIKDVMANPNYTRILSVLYRVQGDPKPAPRILPRSYLFTQLETFYVPVRKKGVRVETSTTKTDRYTGKRPVIPRLSQGTFSNIMATMEAKGLICSGSCTGNKKEQCYRITPEGELALQLAELKTRKP
jgi:hypothetical protein